MDTRQSQDPDDAAALEQRLADLRQLSRDVAEAVAAIPSPETYLDGERAVRAITRADRLLSRIPGEATQPEDTTDATETPPPPKRSPDRLKLRDTADRVLAAIHLIPKPTTFLDADRAARCIQASEVMLIQLYTDPKPAFAAGLDTNDPHLTLADRRQAEMENIDDLTEAAILDHADGIMPDGTSYEDDLSPCEDLFDMSDGIAIEKARVDRRERPLENEEPLDREINYILLGRVNLVTRAHARRIGEWPNGHPFDPDHPDYYSMAAEWEDCVRGVTYGEPSGDEISLEGFPWWVVSRPDSFPDTG